MTRGARSWSVRVVVALTALFLFSGTAANWVVRQATRGRIFAGIDDLPRRPIAIVLGAGVYPDGTPSAVLEDRLRCAQHLFAAHKVDGVLLSGDHGTAHYDEVGAMRAFLLGHGVPADAITLDHAGFRTLDTMSRAAVVFGVTRATVCTQAFHLPRALYLADAAGIDAVGWVADRRPYLGATLTALREWIATLAAVFDVHVLHRRPRFLGPKVGMPASPSRL